MQEKKQHTRNQFQDYHVIASAIEYIETRHVHQPSLARIAEHTGLSEHHFQKLFSRWVGISPKRFLQFLTKEHAKKILDASGTVLDTTYDAGLSSPGRLHDLFVHCEAVTPGEYKKKGSGLDITWGFSDSPFGRCLIANTRRGICALLFQYLRTEKEMFQWLCEQWPQARLKHDSHHIENLSTRIFPQKPQPDTTPLHLYVKGTNFQIKVWEALTRIPSGTAVAYEDIARHIHQPRANRAVGTAVGKNPISYLIPCHRVIRKSGDLGNYGGGITRKRILLGWESARKQTKF